MSFPRYPAYKDSGVEWLGEVPQGWEVVRFSRLILAIKDGTHGTHPRLSEGYPLLSAKNVLNGYLDISNSESLISEEEHISITSNGFPQKNDILLTIVGTIGRVCIYKHETPFAFQRSVCFIRLNSCHSSEYFFYLIESQFFQEQLQCKSKSSAQSGVYMGDVIDTRVILPSIQEQTTIAAFLDSETAKIDNLINEQKKLIELLKEKRQAVISTAVTKGLNPNAPMKDSGVEWLGEVPEHWTIAKVKYFAKMQGGYAFNSNDFKEDGVQLLRIGNVYLNCLELERQPIFVNDSFIESHKDFVVRFGDLLMSLTGTLGKTDYGYAVKVDVHQEFMLNQRLAKIMPNSKITNDYLLYSIRSEPYLRILYSLASGTKQANLSNDDILNIPIFVSPLPEQATIVAFLDQETAKIDNLIQQAQKATTLLQERRTALISAAVTGKIDVRNKSLPASLS